MMAPLLPWLTLLMHAALIAIAAPVLEGLLRRAATSGTSSVMQPWRDLVRMWRKPGLVPAGAWFMFGAAPSVSLGLAAAAALLVPSFALGMGTGGAADLVAVAALLAASRTAPALAAYAGSRVAAARLPAEPVLLLAALVALLMTGSTSLDSAPLRDGALRAPGVLAALALLAWALHEPTPPAIFSGRHLALVTAAAQVRRVAALSAAAVVGLPYGLALAGSGLDAWVVGAAFWVLKIGGLALLGAVIGVHRALLPAAALLALIAAVVVGVQGRV